MTDRAMQALYLMALDPVAETISDKYSFGFRKNRCCADAMIRCHTLLSRSYSPEWVLEGDIRDALTTSAMIGSKQCPYG